MQIAAAEFACKKNIFIIANNRCDFHIIKCKFLNIYKIAIIFLLKMKLHSHSREIIIN